MVDWTLHIESIPEKLYGKPIVKGTRIPVDLVLEKHSSGDSMDDLVAAYPVLTKDDIIACLIWKTQTNS